MVKVKKRNGILEEFSEEKIRESCRKAGSTGEQAACVLVEIVEKVGDLATISSGELSGMVESSLRKVNEGAADSFHVYKEGKYGRES
jgi:transcriptional regulator NrdR family protein